MIYTRTTLPGNALGAPVGGGGMGCGAQGDCGAGYAKIGAADVRNGRVDHGWGDDPTPPGVFPAGWGTMPATPRMPGRKKTPATWPAAEDVPFTAPGVAPHSGLDWLSKGHGPLHRVYGPTPINARDALGGAPGWSALADAGRTAARVVGYDGATGETYDTGQPDARDYASPEDWADAMGDWAEYIGAWDGPIGTGTRFMCPDTWTTQARCPLEADAECTGPPIGAREAPCSNWVLTRRVHLRAAFPNGWLTALGLAEPLSLAWCMVVENIDIVEWAAQLVRPPAAASTFATCLNWTRLNVWVAGTPTESILATVPFSAWTPYVAGSGGMLLYVNTYDVTIQNWIAQYHGGDADTRLCVVVGLASNLAHEAAHGCGFHPIDLGEGTCRDAYMVGNTVKMALLARYPRSMSAACCRTAYGVTTSGVTEVNERLLFCSNDTRVVTTGNCD